MNQPTPRHVIARCPSHSLGSLGTVWQANHRILLSLMVSLSQRRRPARHHAAWSTT